MLPKVDSHAVEANIPFPITICATQWFVADRAFQQSELNKVFGI